MSSAIVGGFVRHLMYLNEEVNEDAHPYSMDIIVPVGRGKDPTAAHKFAHFLSNAGPCLQVTEVESLSSFRLVSQFTFVCSNDVSAFALFSVLSLTSLSTIVSI